MEIDEQCIKLLELSAKHLIRKANQHKYAIKLEKGAFLFSIDDKEVQFQLSIVRKKSDFLNDFETAITREHKSKKK